MKTQKNSRRWPYTSAHGKRLQWNQNTAERPCHIILRRNKYKTHDWQSDFVGEHHLILEPGTRYRVGVTILFGRDGEQELSLYARPLHLYKTAVTPGKLEVVR